MSVHIEAQAGAIAPVVLLPGDPLRAKALAERFLQDACCHNQVRGALGYTGMYRGKRLSVQSTGMGMPSHSIYVHELVHDYGARVLIRVGTCGALQEAIGLRDIVIAMSASTDSGMIRARFGGLSFAPSADFGLLRAAWEIATRRGLRSHVGSVLTSDTFYAHDPDWWKVWARHGVLAAEMETAALYTLAASAGARALSILTVSDHVVHDQRTTAAERQSSFLEMIEVALELGWAEA